VDYIDIVERSYAVVYKEHSEREMGNFQALYAKISRKRTYEHFYY